LGDANPTRCHWGNLISRVMVWNRGSVRNPSMRGSALMFHATSSDRSDTALFKNSKALSLRSRLAYMVDIRYELLAEPFFLSHSRRIFSAPWRSPERFSE